MGIVTLAPGFHCGGTKDVLGVEGGTMFVMAVTGILFGVALCVTSKLILPQSLPRCVQHDLLCVLTMHVAAKWAHPGPWPQAFSYHWEEELHKK